VKALEMILFAGLMMILGVLSVFNSADLALKMVYDNNNVPYGVLWTWMNPYWWTQQPYMLYVFLFELVAFSVQFRLADAGRIPKKLVWINMYLAMFMSAAHVQQEVTVSALAPFVALTPLFLVPIVLEKFPIGWSWPPWASANWACGIGGRCVAFVNDRLAWQYPSFWFRAAIVVWTVACYLLWCKAHPNSRLARLSLLPGRLLMRACRLIKGMVLG